MKKQIQMATCPRCNGTKRVNFGNVANRVCFLCDGTGQVKKNSVSKRFAGMYNGHTIMNGRAKTENEARKKAWFFFQDKKSFPHFVNNNINPSDRSELEIKWW